MAKRSPDIPSVRGVEESAAAPFPPSANAYMRYLMFGTATFFIIGVCSWYAFSRSDYLSKSNVPINQPVLFSHRHHAGDLGIDCRYCHTSVEEAPFAGIPPTETCMTCHSQLYTESVMLEPIRESFATGQPIAWNRVHDLPEFVYFDHSIHVQKGVSCVTCHGEVEQMALVRKQQPLYMDWCLDCHRKHTPTFVPHPENGYAGSPSAEPREINPLTNCYTCHR